MIAIIDYGVGNLFSLISSLKAIGAEAVVTFDPELIKKCDKIILPGVGAFGDAINKLKSSGLDKLIISEAKSGKPILGICLGMQLLFDKSYEFGEFQGLGLIGGEVIPMSGNIPWNLKIPHIGWNALMFKKETPIFNKIKNGDCVYFVHSFYADNCINSITSVVEYGKEIVASVQYENIFGCQFHPEKSGEVGLNILRAFSELEANR